MRLPDQEQGEGLAIRPGGREVLLSSEGAGSDVLALPLSRRIAVRTAPREKPSPSATATEGEPVAEQPDAAASADRGVDPWAVAALAAVTLAAALGVRAWFRRRP